MNKIVVADSGPLIAFSRTNNIALLTRIFSKIIVPAVVADECLVDLNKSGACNIQAAIQNNIIEVCHDEVLSSNDELLELLDVGEATAITLALRLKTYLIIDEKLGRNIAKKLNLRVIGTAGILLLAKEKKLINEVVPLITSLKGAGYFLSDQLIKEVLIRAKELPVS